MEPAACTAARSQTPGQPVNLPAFEVHLSTPFSIRNLLRNTAPPEFGDAAAGRAPVTRPGQTSAWGREEAMVQRGAELFGIDLKAFADRMIPGHMPTRGRRSRPATSTRLWTQSPQRRRMPTSIRRGSRWERFAVNVAVSAENTKNSAERAELSRRTPPRRAGSVPARPRVDRRRASACPTCSTASLRSNIRRCTPRRCRLRRSGPRRASAACRRRGWRHQ